MRQSRLPGGSLSIHLYYYENERTSGRPGVFSFTVSGGKEYAAGKEHMPVGYYLLTEDN